MEILNTLLPYIMPALATILTIVFSYIGLKIKSIYSEKVNTELKQSVVQSAVEFVEQVYESLDGEEKFNTAVEKVIEVLQEKGISITETEVQMLVESAVYGLNQGWLTESTEEDENNTDYNDVTYTVEVADETTSE